MTRLEGQALDIKTHLRTISSSYSAVDANSDAYSFTREEMIEKHVVGGFVNSSWNTDHKANCKYHVVVCETEGFPRVDLPSSLECMDHIVVQATKRIEKDHECIIRYGHFYDTTLLQGV